MAEVIIAAKTTEEEDYPEFSIPAGYESFQEIEDGDEIEVICTIKKKGSDRGCLVAVEGIPVSDHKEEEEESVVTEKMKEETPDDREKRFQQRYRGTMYPS
jgi:hypothetical protein